MFGLGLLDWIVSESIYTNEQTGCASAGTNDDTKEGRVRHEGWRLRGGSGDDGRSARHNAKTVFLDLTPMLAVPVLLLRCAQIHLN